MKILIDNGHGIETPGKRSPDGKFREYAWTRENARMICDMLQAEGYDAELLVPEETDVPLAERCRRVNEWCKKLGKENVLLVSMHVNAAGNGTRWCTARGWSIYTTKGITEADNLAECIWTMASRIFKRWGMVRAYSNAKLGRDYEENFYILLHTYCPVVLIENFFQDNREDVDYLNSDSGKSCCAETVVEGIKLYLLYKEEGSKRIPF